MATGYDLLATMYEQAEFFNFYRSNPPMACPQCGEPLREGPPQQPNVLYCKFDFWQYPRDYDDLAHNGM